MGACVTTPNRAALQWGVNKIGEYGRAHKRVVTAFLALQLLQLRPVRSVAYNFEAIWADAGLWVRVESGWWAARETLRSIPIWSLACWTSNTVENEFKAGSVAFNESGWAHAFHSWSNQKSWTYRWCCFRPHFCHRDGKYTVCCHSSSFYCNRGYLAVSPRRSRPSLWVQASWLAKRFGAFWYVTFYLKNLN